MTDEKSLDNAQMRFDEKYITSTEIAEELDIERSTVLNARRRGMLPDPVTVRGVRVFIWERGPVRPFIDAWKVSLASRRGELL